MWVDDISEHWGRIFVNDLCRQFYCDKKESIYWQWKIQLLDKNVTTVCVFISSSSCSQWLCPLVCWFLCFSLWLDWCSVVVSHRITTSHLKQKKCIFVFKSSKKIFNQIYRPQKFNLKMLIYNLVTFDKLTLWIQNM